MMPSDILHHLTDTAAGDVLDSFSKLGTCIRKNTVRYRVLPASVWVKGDAALEHGERSPSACDPNCLNWQENSSLGVETGRAAAALVAGPAHGSTHTRS